MIYLFFGHRGVGKTNFLNQLEKKQSGVFYDLDEQIRKKDPQIFENLQDHLSSFRALELETLESLCQPFKKQDLFISLGGGFDLSAFKNRLFYLENRKRLSLVWLFRKTDLKAKAFLDRPRLSTGDPLKEYSDLVQQRQKIFISCFDRAIQIPEGLLDWKEHNLFSLPTAPVDIVLDEALLGRLDWLSQIPIRRIELRDDLLNLEKISKINFKKIPAQKWILSIRKEKSFFLSKKAALLFTNKNYLIDCDIDLWKSFYSKEENLWFEKPDILSAHGKDFKSSLEKLDQQSDFNLKLAPQVSCWKDLLEGHRWALKSPSQRSFLPVDCDQNMWSWYRLLLKGSKSLNYIRLYPSPLLDSQPFYSDFQLVKEGFLDNKKFGAVLGSPIQHSFSPVEHLDFQYPFVAIDLSKLEDSFSTLEDMGLTSAAITSPLKKEVSKKIKASRESINTIWKEKEKWLWDNTDEKAMKELFSQRGFDFSNTVLYGGAGLRESFEKAGVSINMYSPRQGIFVQGGLPKEGFTLIWAVPDVHKETDKIHMPPEDWKVTKVLDMNYSQASRGVLFAQSRGLDYESGLDLFQKQAQIQRQIWIKSFAGV